MDVDVDDDEDVEFIRDWIGDAMGIVLFMDGSGGEVVGRIECMCVVRRRGVVGYLDVRLIGSSEFLVFELWICFWRHFFSGKVFHHLKILQYLIAIRLQSVREKKTCKTYSSLKEEERKERKEREIECKRVCPTHVRVLPWTIPHHLCQMEISWHRLVVLI